MLKLREDRNLKYKSCKTANPQLNLYNNSKTYLCEHLVQKNQPKCSPNTHQKNYPLTNRQSPKLGVAIKAT